MPDYVLTQTRARSFYPIFERKPEAQDQTHYCPGCGHGTLHKLIARAIDDLGIQDRTIFVSPVGCSVFAYYYFDTGNVQAAHGRASAVAAAVKRTRPNSIVLSYQGDGDLAAIGTAEIIHAANRGEPITVFFVNNAIYGMTGGQVAPTTPLATKSTTTPFGRTAVNEGYPLHMAELLATLEAPVYIERVALGNNKQVVAAGRAIRRALEIQTKGLGFAFVEILSPCPTIWKQSPVDAQRRVREELASIFPLGVYRDHTAQALPHPPPIEPMPASQIPAFLGAAIEPNITNEPETTVDVDLRIKIAGFGGQGVLLLGELLAEAGMRAGLEVSWLPSYGPEMRSGTSNCSVRLSTRAVDSPIVSRPNVLVAFNEPSERKFIPTVEPGGLILTGFTEPANQLGDVRVANMIALGELIETTQAIAPAVIDATMRDRITNPAMLALDWKAFERGRELVRQRRPS